MAKKPKKPIIRLTELIATNRTGEAQKLLKKYGKTDAKNYGDLENKLIEIYKETSDVKQLEKEIAQMHPHKEFILKNLAPVIETKTDTVVEEPIASKKGKLTIVDSGYSNCEGNPDCNCNKPKVSNACGCGSSSFNGFGAPVQPAAPIDMSHLQHQNNQLIIIATVGLIGIFALIIYKHKTVN